MKKSSWLFQSILIMSTMMVLSANSWINMWIGLEMNLMSFVPIMLKKSNKSNSEAAMIYFLIQSMSSIIMMMMIMINMCNYLISPKIINMTMLVCLLMKMGAAPFHMWMPEIMSKMSWKKCIILMTWQKLAPLMMMSNMDNNNIIMNMSIMLCVIIGSMGGINQTSVRKMMGYSSINHLGWMIAINKSMNKWMIYFIIYSMMNLIICLNFMQKKVYFMNQMNSMNMSNMEKMNLFLMMMSMGGMPPLIGFLPKWITIQFMMNQKEMLIMLIMIMFSMINLMYYMRIMINMIISSNMMIKWNKWNKYNKLMTMTSMMINFSLPLILIMDMY
uniref:NADH-ubiquinone oxidoreductase chain 2 n=1 Tax=Gonopsis affinis TaxID=1874122 RepID=A0A343RQA8_9HEMI|nr:NADH dehydrogenase subunit 2 [Gonopsis affinis]AUF71501.1 NADH dehydrogenase subunit 2 [Gonopsis affinis]